MTALSRKTAEVNKQSFRFIYRKNLVIQPKLRHHRRIMWLSSICKHSQILTFACLENDQTCMIFLPHAYATWQRASRSPSNLKILIFLVVKIEYILEIRCTRFSGHIYLYMKTNSMSKQKGATYHNMETSWERTQFWYGDFQD